MCFPAGGILQNHVAPRATIWFPSRLLDGRTAVRPLFPFLLGLVLAAGCKSDADRASRLKDPDSRRRVEAILYFGLQEPLAKRAEKLLLLFLKEGRSHLDRAAAALCLGKHARKEFIKPLLEALEDPHYLVRMDVVEALGRLPDPKVIRSLGETLTTDEHPWVKLRAAQALGRLEDRRAVPDLITALGDDDSSVRYSARMALENISGLELGREASSWDHWWREQRAKK